MNAVDWFEVAVVMAITAVGTSLMGYWEETPRSGGAS
jgi:hypothetical protein